MATDATIIVGKLDSKQLETAINNLVNTVNQKMTDAADKFDAGLQRMETSLQTFSQKAKTTITDIKDTFKQLGTTFDDFAKAMDKAAKAASSFKPGGVGGGSGSSGAGGAGGASGAGAGDTIGDFKEQIRLQGLKVDAQKKGSDEAQREVDIHKQMNKELKQELKSTQERMQDAAKLSLKNTFSMPTNTLNEARAKLQSLLLLSSSYQGKGILSTEQWNRINDAIDKTKKKLQQLDQAQPKSFSEWTKMTERSLDEVAKKMQALKKIQIDPNNAQQVKQLGDEYRRLSQRQAELMGKGIQLTHSNNYLAQSFSYIRNRIVYALTLGAFTNFMKQLYDIRGQYELLERSLGILVDSMEKGTQVFNELNEMAIKSPFTLIELGGAAKQLAAYNFTADELVDTTRRLADISSALGVPMERLVYNLGQIKAQGRLNARDARDFANAGLAIVPMLAQLYTETKRFGDQQVTTAQVYDMITKKMVSYQDVLSVIYKATDEGGKFFDFQARQAGTLKVQLANLSLAYNNMLNDIGTQHQEALAAPLKAMRWLFKNWQDVYKAIKTVIIILGVFKAQAIMTAVIASMKSLWASLVSVVYAVRAAVSSWAAFTAVLKTNIVGIIAGVLASIAISLTWFGDKVEEVSADMEHFGENAVKTIKKVETLSKIVSATNKESQSYKNTLRELNEILQEYGVQIIKEGENLDAINAKRDRAIELIKREGVERQYSNQMAAGYERYNKEIERLTTELGNKLKNASSGFLGGLLKDKDLNRKLEENAEAITAIVGQYVQENISLIAGKVGNEYMNGMAQLTAGIAEQLKKAKIEEPLVQEFSNIFSNKELRPFIDGVKDADESLTRFTQTMTNSYNNQQKQIKATMTLTDKMKAYERSLQKPSEDTLKLYSRVAELVRDYAKTHQINFEVRFKALVPPEWMTAKDLPELQNLAKRFAALAKFNKNGTKVGGGKDDKNAVFMTQDELMERAYMYSLAAKQKEDALQTEAAREKEAEKERKKLEAQRRKEEAAARAAANRAHANQVKQENEVAKALKDEISLIKEMQGNYDKLRKAGFNNYDAINIAATGYEETIERINSILKKYGITEFDAKDFAGKDINQLLDTLKTQRATLIASGKVKLESLKDLDVEINKLNVDAKSVNLKKLTDSLNSELNNLKDEYELSVELDANPELAEAFKEMFNLDTSSFPHTMDEYMTKAQGLFDKIREVSGYTQDLNIFKASDKEWETWANNVGISDEKMKEIKDKFKTVVAVTKKWVEDTIKQTKDLEYKLADTNGKIAIEEEKLSRLRIQYEKETREEKKRLLELQIQDQENTIEKLRAEIFELLPAYQKVFGSVAEHSASMTRKLALQLKKILDEAKKNDDGSFTVTDPSGKTARISAKERGKQLDKVNKELSKTKPILDKIKEAFKKGEDGEIDYAEGIDLVGQELQKLGDLVNTIGDISESLGLNEGGQEAVNDFANVLGGLGQAAQGYAQLQSGDIIGGAANIIKGAWTAIGTFFDNSNNRINRQIEDSERRVRFLEVAYKDLQNAVEDAYGTMIISAKKAAIANKQAQLIEVERQLTLEESRKSKDRDDDKVADLMGQVNDLKRELETLNNDIVNDLLGISGVGDAMESLMDGFVEALRSGEDAMESFNGSVDDMIANMVKKMFTTKILQPWFEEQWGRIQENINKRGEQTQQYILEYQQTLAQIASGDVVGIYKDNGELETDKKKMEEIVNKKLEELQNKLVEETMITPDDIKEYAEILRSGQPIMEENMKEISDLLRELGLIKDTASTNNLSALQQGIQGVTEETAGALEAYMNSVSQQVYYQSDILTQIRDAVLMINSDVELATQSQILLQLQNNYIIMETMAALMNGWTTPNGQGIRVELVN